MNWVMLATGEMASSRFDRLVEALGAETRDDRYRMFGHLAAWSGRWAQDQEYDSGLFFDSDEKRMGMWADWSDPRAFGRALVKAGYVDPMAKVYPAELLNGRTGLVARSPSGGVMLDVSWQSVHRRRGHVAHELFLFLTDRRMRVTWAREYGVPKGRPIPAGWLEDAASGIASPAGSTEAPGAIVAPGFDARGSSPLRQDGRGPGSHAGSVGGSGNGSAGGEAPPARADVGFDVKKGEAFKATATSGSMRPQGFQPNGGAGSRATGRRKDDAMRDIIRRERYDNPLMALTATDDSPSAVKLWREAVDQNPNAVRELLANMVETDEAWVKIGCPAAILTSKLLPMVRAGRRRR